MVLALFVSSVSMTRLSGSTVAVKVTSREFCGTQGEVTLRVSPGASKSVFTVLMSAPFSKKLTWTDGMSAVPVLEIRAVMKALSPTAGFGS